MCKCLTALCGTSAANPLDDFGGAHGMTMPAAILASASASGGAGAASATPGPLSSAGSGFGPGFAGGQGDGTPFGTPMASPMPSMASPGGTVHQRKHSHGAMVPR